MLVADGLVPVFPTPVAHRGHCTGKAALGRNLPDHVLHVPRPSPNMGKAEEPKPWSCTRCSWKCLTVGFGLVKNAKCGQGYIRTRIHQMSKRLFFGLRVMALPLGMLYATSLAQAQSSIASYACAAGQGTVHRASDLKGSDLRKHQTADGFTCYLASKPSESNGSLSCTSPSALHRVSDLTGGVLLEHQEGNPPETCIEGNLPICAAGFSSFNSGNGLTGAPMTPNDICIPSKASCGSCNPSQSSECCTCNGGMWRPGTPAEPSQCLKPVHH